MKDAPLQFQITQAKLRGQCYDGCSTITGAKAGVAAKIEEIEPRAVFTHCYGHSVNLSVSDTIKHLPAMKDCLDTSFELVKLIKFSPKRETMLHELKEELAVMLLVCAPCAQQGGLFVQSLWPAYLQTMIAFSWMKTRIQGVASQMHTFKFLFGLILCEMILWHTDKLNQTLQQPKLSSVEGHEVVMLIVKTLQLTFADRWKLWPVLAEGWENEVPVRHCWTSASKKTKGYQSNMIKAVLLLSLQSPQRGISLDIFWSSWPSCCDKHLQ